MLMTIPYLMSFVVNVVALDCRWLPGIGFATDRIERDAQEITGTVEVAGPAPVLRRALPGPTQIHILEIGFPLPTSRIRRKWPARPSARLDAGLKEKSGRCFAPTETR